MCKKEFLDTLRDRLKGIPAVEADERLAFYGEMIDDRVEEGMSEAEAVDSLGSVDAVASQILADIPLTRLIKERVKPKRRLGAWEIVLLSVGSPLWLSLAASAFAVVISLFAALWAVIGSLWAVFAALVGCGLGGALGGLGYLFSGNGFMGAPLFFAGVFGAGLAIFAFIGCLAATKGAVALTRKTVLLIKRCFVRKEREDA